MDDRPPREMPLHMLMALQDLCSGEWHNVTCFGCSRKGHQMDQYERIKACVNQGHIKWVMGQLRWHNGLNIM